MPSAGRSATATEGSEASLPDRTGMSEPSNFPNKTGALPSSRTPRGAPAPAPTGEGNRPPPTLTPEQEAARMLLVETTNAGPAASQGSERPAGTSSFPPTTADPP